MSFEPVVAAMMTTDPTVVAPTDRLHAAAREMELGSIRHLPVVASDGTLVGVLSQRDVLGELDPQARVEDAMSTDMKTVAPTTPAHEAAYLLLRHKIGCVPVVGEHGRLVGIVTEADFVRVAYTLLGGRVAVDQLELEEEEADRV
jgi:CBS domain-containing membrane protein